MPTWLSDLFALIAGLVGLAPKVVDGAQSPELGPPPPEADKDALMKELESEKAQKFGK
jgi:hypothetical protein